MATLKVKDQPSAEFDSRITSAPIIISMVEHAAATETRSVDAERIISAIKTSRWEKPVKEIRLLYDDTLLKTSDRKKAKLAVDLLKKKLPAILPSGKFSRRANDALTEHSGLICADLDSLGNKLQEVRAKLLSSPYVYALFRSPTGDGLKAWFHVPADASKHLGSFRAVERHILGLTGVQIDEACKDVARLCFVSSDRNAYLNLNAQGIEPLPEPAAPAAPPSAGYESKPSKAEIREMLGLIPKRPHYPDWIKIVAAVGDVLPDDEAIDVLIEWSPEERDGEYEEKLRHRLTDVRIGTLIYLARAHGWTPNIDIDKKRPDLRGSSRRCHGVTDEETFTRLAALPRTEYDRVRKVEAANLGIRPSTLDDEVEKRRPRPAANLQGAPVHLREFEPWETSVNGADVLNEVAAMFSRYVALPRGAADVLALWTAHTHCFEAFDHSPRLNVCSAEKNCGKTTVLNVARTMVARPARSENMTVAVMFRLVAANRPTLLLDEVDSYCLNESEELRGLLNAGHGRDGVAFRCIGDTNEVRQFPVYAPVALAGIGALPPTLHDRSIGMKLERARPREISKSFDSRRDTIEYETELGRKLVRWANDNFDKLRSEDPKLPDTAFNRLADNWRPLFAIAEVVGGDWPQRAHAAFSALTVKDDLDAQGVGTTLLFDIREIFATASADRMPSSELADALAKIEGRYWAEWGKHRRPISTNQLAQQLRRFGVLPHVIRVGEETPRGYLLDDFKEAFSRYLPSGGCTDRNTATTLGKTAVSEAQQRELVLHPENSLSSRESCGVAPCTEGEAEDSRTTPSKQPDPGPRSISDDDLDAMPTGILEL